MTIKKEKFVGEELLCPMKYFLEVAGGKWKTSIICILATGEPHRYSRIRRKLGNITNTMLAKSLQELEDEDIVERIQYNEIPPRVEYLLTDKGKTIVPILLKMAEWSAKTMADKGNATFCKKCQSME
ncbi:helix-turn-helix domain-containing protein [Peptostreptococcus stomatis]|uniref:winged helix-turn-helix transcriptional regulator n=1 Tax=Peptostreptococcus stomatis TaxID=341694 RepID=UPI0028D608EA|nr:helix-turn-helix domain-containing protein [Peptostreptococcus stomatis]